MSGLSDRRMDFRTKRDLFAYTKWDEFPSEGWHTRLPAWVEACAITHAIAGLNWRNELTIALSEMGRSLNAALPDDGILELAKHSPSCYVLGPLGPRTWRIFGGNRVASRPVPKTRPTVCRSGGTIHEVIKDPLKAAALIATSGRKLKLDCCRP